MIHKKYLLLSVILFINKSECLDSVAIHVDDQLATEQEQYKAIEYRKPKAKHDKQNSFNATAPGQLDRTFGTDGRVTTTSFNGVLTGIAIRQTTPDDYEIVTTGFAFSTLTYMPLVTYNIDGNKIAKIDFSSTTPPTTGAAIAIDSLNRIVIGGEVKRALGTTNSSFMARRYRNPTTVDSTFGTAIASYGASATNSFKTTSIAIDNQNRVLLGGSVLPSNQERWKLVRFYDNGQLDSTFGGSNATNRGFSDSVYGSRINGIALQENGDIFVAGSADIITQGSLQVRFSVGRYTANGILVWSTVTDFTPLGLVNKSARANAVALQKDGKIVAVGTTATNATGTGQAFVLARYNPDGTLDTTFGSGGLQVAPFNSAISEATAVAIDDNGFIIVAGYTTPTGSSHQSFAVAAFNPDGSLNSEFGTNGLVVTAFGNNQNVVASSVAIEPISKRIIVGGTITQDTTNHFALACYNGLLKKQAPLPVARFSSNGILDPRFGK
ncbi:MAG: delta-60 repeat domain-containing protein [Candidatus Dependentiae bacterium]|nr:delta-60 repeat domain-containing protein [Candidatus Dependentiae bacterium]